MRSLANRGFTLLEVLIALLVFSLGLMGLAGLLVVSVQTNHSAYLRTQASFLAQSMADRMHANVLGVWKGSYSGTSGATYSLATIAATGTTCLDTNLCGYADIAKRDGQVWSNQLVSFLPNPTAIASTCAAPATTPSADKLVERPPYGATCDINIVWGQSNLQAGDTTVGTESLDWVFQP